MATVAIEQKERCPQFSQRKQPDEKVAHLKFQNIDYLPLAHSLLDLRRYEKAWTLINYLKVFFLLTWHCNYEMFMPYAMDTYIAIANIEYASVDLTYNVI